MKAYAQFDILDWHKTIARCKIMTKFEVEESAPTTREAITKAFAAGLDYAEKNKISWDAVMFVVKEDNAPELEVFTHDSLPRNHHRQNY